MANEIPVYPTQIWDGLSRNEARTDIKDDIAPNSEDWSRMVAEVIKLQKHVGVSSLKIATADGDKLVFDFAEAKNWESTETGTLDVISLKNASPGDVIFIRIIQGTGSAASVDWTDSGSQVIRFPSGVAPTQSSGLGKIDDFQIVVNNDLSFNVTVLGLNMLPV